MMRGYLYALAAAAVVISVVSAIAPASMSGHVRALCALCMICIVCAPLSGAMQALQQGEWEIPEAWLGENEQDLEADFEQFSKQMLAGQLTLRLEREFSIASGDVEVLVTWENEERPAYITLLLSGKAIWQDPGPLKDYVKDLLGCECIVVLD